MSKVKPIIALNLISGILIMAVNLYWIVHNIRLYWLYHYTSVLFVYMLPDWVLFTNVAWGCIGLFAGLQVIRGRLKPLSGILFQLGIVIIWTLADVFHYEVMEFLNLF
ncbi:MAG: hypothetical protein Roseis2KO_41050 [Roseivirga sp.]